MLNNFHPSTIICPITSKVNNGVEILRIRLNKKSNNLPKESDILVDQIRAIDNKRFLNKIGSLTEDQKIKLIQNIKNIIAE